MQIDSLSPKSAAAAGGAKAAGFLELGPAGGSPSESLSFGKVLEGALDQVNSAQQKSAELTEQFAAGAPVDVHKVMIAAQEASVALSLALQVRNKVVDAYQEVMRISV